jgi:hypothetical protein|tara:strand:+ start:36 stop:290 length:255 start_codon:yes stop_codon:yes gene_type:complete
MNYKKNEILTRFHENGEWPTDSGLQIILDENGITNRNIYDLEMELLDIASNDVNHPYYPSTQPIKGGPKMGIDENGYLTFDFIK